MFSHFLALKSTSDGSQELEQFTVGQFTEALQSLWDFHTGGLRERERTEFPKPTPRPGGARQFDDAQRQATIGRLRDWHSRGCSPRKIAMLAQKEGLVTTLRCDEWTEQRVRYLLAWKGRSHRKPGVS